MQFPINILIIGDRIDSLKIVERLKAHFGDDAVVHDASAEYAKYFTSDLPEGSPLYIDERTRHEYKTINNTPCENISTSNEMIDLLFYSERIRIIYNIIDMRQYCMLTHDRDYTIFSPWNTAADDYHHDNINLINEYAVSKSGLFKRRHFTSICENAELCFDEIKKQLKQMS